MYVLEESDCAILPMKLTNNEDKTSAEPAEGRAQTKENDVQPHTHPTQSGARVSQGLDGVRQKARGNKQERFTALLHHLTVDLLRESFYALKRHAATGIDGISRQQYEQGLEARLVELHGRVHRWAISDDRPYRDLTFSPTHSQAVPPFPPKSVGSQLAMVVPVPVLVAIPRAFAVIDLPHPDVVPPAEAFAVFVLCPSWNGVRIAVLVTVVYVRPAMVFEVAVRTPYAIVEPSVLHGLFGSTMSVLERRWSIVLLRKCVSGASEHSNGKRGYQ
jgi:hypothetical protein